MNSRTSNQPLPSNGLIAASFTDDRLFLPARQFVEEGPQRVLALAFGVGLGIAMGYFRAAYNLFEPLTEIGGEVLVALAVRLGKTRLIDNVVLGGPSDLMLPGPRH